MESGCSGARWSIYWSTSGTPSYSDRAGLSAGHAASHNSHPELDSGSHIAELLQNNHSQTMPIYSVSGGGSNTKTTVRSMSDEQLSTEYNSNAFNMLLPEFLLSDHQRQVRTEFDTRFKEQIRETQVGAVGFMLSAPLRFLVEKATDHDFGIGYGPEDTVFGSRMVGLESFNQKDFVKKIEKLETVDIGFEPSLAEIDSIGTELGLKLKPGGNKQAFDKKFEALQALAEEGKLVKTTPGVRDQSVITVYRREMNMKIQQQWGERNPEFATRATERFGKYMDVDHIHELQLGGQDIRSNLQMLDQGVNRSFGAQVRHQLGKLPDGTKITKVIDTTKQVD